jgi:enoyl-CoA hydratase/carnithine racemase
MTDARPSETQAFGTSENGEPLVRLESASAVARLSMNRPQARNALSVELCGAITEAVTETERFPSARVLILRGEGKVFCAGADYSAISGPEGLDFLPAFERMLDTVSRCRVPVVAAIQGAALGGGLQLAVACDFRIVAMEAKLGIPSARLGIVVNFENVQRLVLLVGPSLAREMLMAARTFDGAAAEEAGLVNRSVGAGDLEATVEEFASNIAELAPLSVQGAKKTIQAVADHLSDARTSQPNATAEVDRLVVEAYNSNDLAEGLASLSAKRRPDFKGH